MPFGVSDVTFIFEFFDKVLSIPTALSLYATQSAEFASGLQANDSKGIGADHALYSVKRKRYSFVTTETTESCSSALGLMRNHTADCSGEDARRFAEVNWVSSWIGVHAFSKPVHKLGLLAKVNSGNVYLFASYH